MTIWRCKSCSIEGPAESFPLHKTVSQRCPILKFQTTIGSTRLACPNCGGRLTPKTSAEIEAEENARFIEWIEQEIGNSGRVAGTAAESNAEKPDAGGGARVMRRSLNGESNTSRQSGETGNVHALPRANSSDRVAAAMSAAATSSPAQPEMRP